MDISGVCTSALGVAFHGSGLNPHKNYEVQAALGGSLQFTSGVVVNKGGSYSAPGEVGFISPGSWTFTLSELDSSRSVVLKDLVVEMGVLFE